MRTMQLLQPKLQRPRIPRHFVPRPRLFERLDQGSQGPLTLVCAGAGYGKTTLVSAWIESLAARNQSATRQPAAWISLDERDSDLDIFLRYFIAGLHTMFADPCPNTSSLLQATRQPPLEVLCATLINEIACLPQDFILVLDDHHAIVGRAVDDLFRELEYHWPQPMHLVLISRHNPALSLDAWRAKGRLTEIRARDLRFTADEAAAYLRHALRTPLSQTAIELVERRTEGWIAGLQLASLVLQDAEDPEGLLASLSGSNAEFADYLAHDVLSHQPAAIQSFLFQTAILDQFCVALCETAIPAEDPEWSARRCIDWVERSNLFLVSLDSHKEWYRYHQMFRGMLLQRAGDAVGPDRVTELRRKAAAWYAHRGLVDEAVRHALAAGDRELAAGFVAQGLCEALNREDRPTLERWLALFPDEFIQDRLDLLIVRGFSLFFSWQLSPLGRVVQRAGGLLEREMSTTLAEVTAGALRGCLASMSAIVAYFGGDPDRAIACSREALALLPEAWSFARSGSVLFQALAMQVGGQGQAAVRLLIENYEGLTDRESSHALRLLLGLGLVYFRQTQDLERVIQIAQKLVDVAERNRLRIVQSWGLFLLGLAHYQRNEMVAAKECFARLLDFRYTGNVGALRDGVQRLALIHQLAGQQTKAWEMLQFLVQLDVDQMGHEADETGALRARLWLMRGELDSAARWADAFTAPAADQPWVWQDPPHMIKARILLARDTAADVRSALEILDAFYEMAEHSHNMRLKIEVLALRALALGALERAGDARNALQAAVDLARPGGFLHVFLDLGPSMEEALGRLARQEVMPRLAEVRRILAEFGDQATGAARGGEAANLPIQVVAPKPRADANGSLQPLVESLTPRELEIALLLRSPLSLKEIAGLLFISHGTLRRHTINIYGKLDVHRRWDAVTKAEALGLIPPR